MELDVTDGDGVVYDATISAWQVTKLPVFFNLANQNKTHFPGGAVLIRGVLKRQGAGFEARLIAHTDHQSYSYGLPMTLKGKLVQVINLPEGVVKLEIQPLDAKGRFSFHGLNIKKLTLAEKLYRQIDRVVTVFQKTPLSQLRQSGFRWHMAFWNLDKAYQILSDFSVYAPKLSYDEWISRFDVLNASDQGHILERIGVKQDVMFDIVLLGNAKKDVTLSISEQLYKGYRLWTLDEWLGRDASLKVSDWILFIDESVILRPHALYWIMNEIKQNPDCSVIYSDHDSLDEKGDRISPEFKPQWSPELLISMNYLGEMMAIKASLLANMTIDESLSVYQLALLALPQTEPFKKNGLQVRRIAAVLYHQQRRASDARKKPKTLIKSFLEQNKIMAEVTEQQGFNKVIYTRQADPLVSIIVPTRDMLDYLKRCVESVLEKTTYASYEILIVNNQSEEPETLDYLASVNKRDNVRVLDFDLPFNYSAINNFAASHANGRILCLLNNDTEVITPEWLDIMVGQLQQPNVGIVGAKLLYGDHTVQHVGDAVGPGGCADHFTSGIDEDEPGYCLRAIVAQDLSAVTAACLLTPKSLFDQLNGLDGENLVVAFNDVDYCLRVRELGQRVVLTPYAKLFHHESASRGKDTCPQKAARSKKEADFIRKRWRSVLKDDPFYNPNLNYKRPDFSLSRMPMVDKPWLVSK